MITALVQGGADINCSDSGRATPLHRLCMEEGSLDAIRTLLSLSADPNIPDAGFRTPLFVAISPRYIEALLAAGADVNAIGLLSTGLEGTALHIQVAKEPFRLDCIAALLDAGANVNATTFTPLHLVFPSELSEEVGKVASLLLASGAHTRDLFELKTPYEEFLNNFPPDPDRSHAVAGLRMLSLFSAYGDTRSHCTTMPRNHIALEHF